MFTVLSNSSHTVNELVAMVKLAFTTITCRKRFTHTGTLNVSGKDMGYAMGQKKWHPADGGKSEP